MSEFINVSKIKKLVHSCKRRVSADFLEELDAAIKAYVEKICASAGSMVTLGKESVYLVSPTKKVTDTRTDLRQLLDEVVTMEMNVNVVTRDEYLKRVRSMKSICEKLLTTEPK
jgi:histone H3/H4